MKAQNSTKKWVLFIGTIIFLISVCVGYFLYMFRGPNLSYDLNGDGNIGISDISQLSAKMGEPCDNCPEDINRDGKVDTTDMKILMQNFHN